MTTAECAPNVDTLETADIIDIFNAKFAEFWEALPPRVKRDRWSGDPQERLYACEQAFLSEVLAAVAQLADKHSGPITILFDVDETIAKNYYDEDENVTTFVRPSMHVLCYLLDKVLGDQEYSIGLLTSRGHDHLEAEVEAPTYLASVFSKIDPKFIISSRLNSPIYALADIPHSFYSESAEAEALQSIINPDLKAAIDEERYDDAANITPTMYSAGKLPILVHIANQNPNRGFLIVDDLPYPNAIDPDNQRVCGLALSDAAKFYL